ncbi:glutamate-cysteine ligase family protein [Myxococcota bacterium]|nr:glutamate-cysteine ligase family protein [Myxococcota bacterium]
MTLTDTQRAALATLTARFDGAFPQRTGQWRRVGRESEHPVVYPDGKAGDINELWPLLAVGGDLKIKREGELIVSMEGDDYGYCAEVGRGTIEVILSPSDDLVDLERKYLVAMERLVRAADAKGLRVLGYGMQPVQAGTVEFMAPKQRYGAILEALGPIWLWFTLTASDQVHIDVSREEWVRLTNLGNLLSPVTVALCANSSVFEGKFQGMASSREGQMGRIGAAEFRHGMPVGAAQDAAAYVLQRAVQPLLVRRENGVIFPGQGSFLDYVEAERPDDDALWDAFLLHEHYIWNSARPRSAIGTIELRAACQQPPEEPFAAAALGLAIIAAADELEALLLARLGEDPWPKMREWHHAAVTQGLAADEPTPGLLDELLRLCEDGLRRRGRGEERYLKALRRRVQRAENPAQEAVRLLATGGPATLVERFAWPVP